MRTSQNILATINTIGIDVGKNTFHLVGLDKRGARPPLTPREGSACSSNSDIDLESSKDRV
jgi:hypothetical protein